MVHPYLRRRGGAEAEHYPSPAPAHGPADELKAILGKTKGVPLFQEQAMRIALVAAKFSDAEVNELRKAMATFRRRGTIGLLEEKMVSRMVARGYTEEFAQRCFNQIKGFGEYGFPESHAASFAHLVYVSAWIKCHYPAAFAAALLNSQPMGFYAPAQIVRDAREHGVEAREADVNLSDWDCTLEDAGVPSPRSYGERVRVRGSHESQRQPLPLTSRRSRAPLGPLSSPAGRGSVALRLGLRQIDGLQEEEVKKLIAARCAPPLRPSPFQGEGGKTEGTFSVVPAPRAGNDPRRLRTRSMVQGAGASSEKRAGKQPSHFVPSPLPGGGRENRGRLGHLCRIRPRKVSKEEGLSPAPLLPRREGSRWRGDGSSEPFRDAHDLWLRAGVKLSTLGKLAAADAFRSLGLDRRQALWEVKALTSAEPLPLFSWSRTREAGLEPQVALPAMALSEHVVNDYQTLRLSLKAHPMSFLRAHLSQWKSPRSAPPLNVIPAQAGTQNTNPLGAVEKNAESAPPGHRDLGSRLRGNDGGKKERGQRILACHELRAAKDGAYVSVAGVVLVRQRPGSAKGVVFMTIEDETGVANAVVWPKTLERFRKVVMGARLIVIHGRIQRHEDIIHVVSGRLEDRSDWLALLSEAAHEMTVPLANADHVRSPDVRAEQSGLHNGHPRWAGHPRHERIIPKSRDFH
jgi:DNA polymerase III alpha subunit